MSDFNKIPLEKVTWRDAIEAAQKQNAPSSMAPSGSAEFPATDGYYWMQNTVDEGRAIWRIVNVFSRGHPERNGMQRIARDCCSVFTKEELADWKGVYFHGPIHPPNRESSHAGTGSQ